MFEEMTNRVPALTSFVATRYCAILADALFRIESGETRTIA